MEEKEKNWMDKLIDIADKAGWFVEYDDWGYWSRYYKKGISPLEAWKQDN